MRSPIVISGAIAGLAIVFAAGCMTSEPAKTQPAKQAAPAAAAAPVAAAPVAVEAVKEFYEVHADGRLFAFSNVKIYQEYLSTGEAALRLTQIGKGPNGGTLVFGLTKAESKNPLNMPFVKLYSGQAAAAEKGFYGETFYNNRFYVFDEWKAMQAFRSTREAPIVVTHIGKGPERKTVVLVRSKSSVKDQASTDALLSRFKSNHKL